MIKEEAIEKLKKFDFVGSNEDIEFLTALDMAIKALEQEPKTGHWVVYSELIGEWEGTKKYACDKCGEKVGVFKSNYCPNCGAKMEGENK